MEENTVTDWSGQTLYAGIDVGKNRWAVTVRVLDLELKTFVTDGSKESCLKALRRNWPGAKMNAVYEAGYFGYHIADYLNEHGIETIIVSPQKILREPGNFIKTDKIDSRQLAEHLAKGMLRGIYQRAPELLMDRGLVRKRGQMVRRRVQIQQQMKADLAFYGIKVKTTKSGHWSKRYVYELRKVVEECSHQYYATVFAMFIKEYEQLCVRIRKATKLVGELSMTDRYREKVKLLKGVPGISTLSAMILLTEIGDIHRFDSQDKFASYLGLIPCEYSSGDRVRKGSLTGMGHSLLRRIFTEISWVGIRKDPALLTKFDRVRIGKSKTKAIIAVAKCMANRVRRILITEEPYVIGVVV